MAFGDTEDLTKLGTVDRFSTFQGVFRPITLTVLGAMLYLREGWLVGNSGLFGALVVIFGAYAITGTTALSVSSLSTNVRVRSGGAFAIIAQALGLEAGGAIGIPLYLAQTASAAMYLYAFTEAWAVLFPTHSTSFVVLLAFLGVAAVAWRSAGFAFRTQAVMLWVVVVALASGLLGWFTADTTPMTWRGSYPEATLSEAFAIFFPAATGIMVGVGMSGSLENPRDSLPRGTLGAWAVTLAAYVVFAFWYASVGTPSELLENKTILVAEALISPLVLIGLLCATLTAALSSLVAAPRLLAAMGRQGVVPRGTQLAQHDLSGEPRAAMLCTFAGVAICLLSGSLDAIAPIVSSFFILTYLAINGVVFIEQQLRMISYRPTFQIPIAVPLVGFGLCWIGLVLCSAFFGIFELGLVVGIYSVLQRRKLETPWETVRSGISVSVADWAAQRTAGLARTERAWKPDLLVPIPDVEEAESLAPLLAGLTRQNGSVKLVGLRDTEALREGVARVVHGLQQRGIYASGTIVEGKDFVRDTQVAMDVMGGAFFPPNLVVIDASRHDDEELQPIIDRCKERKLGLVLFLPHPDGGIGKGHEIATWLSDRSPNWQLKLHNANLDLVALVAYLLSRGRGHLRIATVVKEADQRDAAQVWLRRLVDMGRLGPTTATDVFEGDFLMALSSSAKADVHVLGLSLAIEVKRLQEIRDASGGACVFLLDSGYESVLS